MDRNFQVLVKPQRQDKAANLYTNPIKLSEDLFINEIKTINQEITLSRSYPYMVEFVYGSKSFYRSFNVSHQTIKIEPELIFFKDEVVRFRIIYPDNVPTPVRWPIALRGVYSTYRYSVNLSSASGGNTICPQPLCGPHEDMPDITKVKSRYEQVKRMRAMLDDSPDSSDPSDLLDHHGSPAHPSILDNQNKFNSIQAKGGRLTCQFELSDARSTGAIPRTTSGASLLNAAFCVEEGDREPGAIQRTTSGARPHNTASGAIQYASTSSARESGAIQRTTSGARPRNTASGATQYASTSSARELGAIPRTTSGARPRNTASAAMQYASTSSAGESGARSRTTDKLRASSYAAEYHGRTVSTDIHGNPVIKELKTRTYACEIQDNQGNDAVGLRHSRHAYESRRHTTSQSDLVKYSREYKEYQYSN